LRFLKGGGGFGEEGNFFLKEVSLLPQKERIYLL